MQPRLKKARANVSELLHDVFLVNAARFKEMQWHGLNGREKLLFLEAVSKQWNACQENAAATVIPPAEAKVIWAHAEEARSGKIVSSSHGLCSLIKMRARSQPRIH